MKNLAILGVMFLSLGAFAQQAPNREVRQKEQVCVVKRDHVQEVQKSDKMILAPVQNVPKHAHFPNGQRKQAPKAHMIDQKMVPLERKDAHVK